jgi:hypothetical protein
LFFTQAGCHGCTPTAIAPCTAANVAAAVPEEDHPNTSTVLPCNQPGDSCWAMGDAVCRGADGALHTATAGWSTLHASGWAFLRDVIDIEPACFLCFGARRATREPAELDFANMYISRARQLSNCTSKLRLWLVLHVCLARLNDTSYARVGG